MRALVEINHYPEILEKMIDVTHMRLKHRSKKAKSQLTQLAREFAFRIGLDYLEIKRLALRYMRFDLIICTNLPTILAAKFAKTMGYSGTIVFDDYGVWPWRGYLPWSPLAAFFPAWVRTNIASCRKYIDYVVTPSEFERKNAIERYGFNPDMVYKIPYTIRNFFSKPIHKTKLRGILGVKNSEFILTYVGRLNPIKGIDRLIRAFAAIKNEIPSRLIIVGRDQGFLKKIIKLCKTLDVSDGVRYLGFIPYRKMPEVYAASDVVIIPSLYETFCSVALEAMACGTPVVASNVGSLPEVVGEAGILCKPNPESIAEAIKKLWFDKELLENLRWKGPKRARKLRLEAENALKSFLCKELCVKEACS
ncbi:MAG TPA: glycosyltransferase family 1 protein [Candidatus Korarchaeota archaeon]|nr:glycosyltransferase family 1 protein [Candidatus Korarchaeota archaeon]